MITITGGGGILATEAGARHGLHLAKLSAGSLARLAAIAPEWQHYENPADIWPPSRIAGHPLDEVLYTTLDTFLSDGNVHGLMMVMPGAPQAYLDSLAEAFRLTSKFDKPVALWCYGSEVMDTVETMEREGRIVYYPTHDRAANALSRLNEYYRFLERYHAIQAATGKG